MVNQFGYEHTSFRADFGLISAELGQNIGREEPFGGNGASLIRANLSLGLEKRNLKRKIKK
jgi:hypothetical protein